MRSTCWSRTPGLIRPQQIDEIDAAAFDEVMFVNLRAPFLLARRVVPGMQERGFGRVLFTSSVAAFTGGLVGPHYAASKAGLHAIVHYLARRLAADGVTVNAIAPALIRDTGDLSSLGDVDALARESARRPPGDSGRGRRHGAGDAAQRLHDQPGRVVGRRYASALSPFARARSRKALYGDHTRAPTH